MSLLIQKLDKHFANGKHALRDINLYIGDSEMVALIGASVSVFKWFETDGLIS